MICVRYAQASGSRAEPNIQSVQGRRIPHPMRLGWYHPLTSVPTSGLSQDSAHEIQLHIKYAMTSARGIYFVCPIFPGKRCRYLLAAQLLIGPGKCP